MTRDKVFVESHFRVHGYIDDKELFTNFSFVFRARAHVIIITFEKKNKKTTLPQQLLKRDDSKSG